MQAETPRPNIATEKAQCNPKGGRIIALLRSNSGFGRHRPLLVAAEQHKPNLTVGGITEAAVPIGLIPKDGDHPWLKNYAKALTCPRVAMPLVPQGRTLHVLAVTHRGLRGGSTTQKNESQARWRVT